MKLNGRSFEGYMRFAATYYLSHSQHMDIAEAYVNALIEYAESNLCRLPEEMGITFGRWLSEVESDFEWLGQRELNEEEA